MDPVALVIEVGSMSGMMNRFAAAALCLAAAAGDEGTTRATCEALAAQRGLAAGAAACGFGEGPRWVAYNNLGLAHYVGGRPALARQHFARAARLAPLEPVALANLLWLEVVENRAEAEETTAVVAELARRAEAAAVAAALATLAGAPADSRLGAAATVRGGVKSFALHGNASVAFERTAGGDRRVRAERLPRWAADEREPGDDALWAPPASAGGAALARWVTGFLGTPRLRDAAGPLDGALEPSGRPNVFDVGFENVAAGGARAWDDAGKGGVLSFAHVGSLNLLQAAVEDVCARGVAGDVAECGVFRGGTAALAAAALEAFDASDSRRVFAVGAGERLRIVKGPFAASLPAAAEPARVAVLRVDADTFEGTRDALDHLYDRVAPGGLVIVDDYHLGGCRRAVREFREARGVAAPLLPAPIDYVLTCPRLPANKRALLAEDVLLHGRRILQPQMFVAQNVYWRKP
ncbi:macrocin-O-methyltransferase [Aureococcus anophagefferens]|nr:macrocin-O-methyltransferase [Aureococcus anophagefferens]